VAEVHYAQWVGFDRVHPKVKYFRVACLLDHSLDKTDDKGGQQPLINWTQLTDAARGTLNIVDLLGDASVKFRDDNILAELDSSWKDGY
jgi:hypothetical protein